MAEGFTKVQIGGPQEFEVSYDLSIAYMPVIGRARYNFESLDPIRYSTLELLCNEISSRNVAGAIAELGVYRGDFLHYLHQCLPDRNIFEYDTFEDFNIHDVDAEKYLFPSKNFKDTSLELVRQKLSSAAQKNLLHIRKGHFPGSILESDRSEHFCLVSLDADLFEPMIRGLHFFFRRMSAGGYIAVHNYNDFTYPGTRKAVDAFLAEYIDDKTLNPKIVPVSDPGGTLIIAF